MIQVHIEIHHPNGTIEINEVETGALHSVHTASRMLKKAVEAAHKRAIRALDAESTETTT
jgi:hypothetical protein